MLVDSSRFFPSIKFLFKTQNFTVNSFRQRKLSVPLYIKECQTIIEQDIELLLPRAIILRPHQTIVGNKAIVPSYRVKRLFNPHL